MSNYLISNEADEDLVRIFQYGMYQFGLDQADDYLSLLYSYFETIAQNPYSFEAVDHILIGYRRCVCKSNSIFYVVLGNTVEIRAIVGNQDIGNII